VLWGEQLGAALRDMTGHQGHGSVAHPQGILVSWAVIMEGGFQVNTAATLLERGLGYSEAALSVLRQPGGIAWTCSTPASPASPAVRGLPQRRGRRRGSSAPTSEALAEAARLPAQSLAATLAGGGRAEGPGRHGRLRPGLVRRHAAPCPLPCGARHRHAVPHAGVAWWWTRRRGCAWNGAAPCRTCSRPAAPPAG
jgi:fumarate reductase flavoprotein subunit